MTPSAIIHYFAITVALFMPACSTHPFSGAAAMRIEVEVYKGPLSLDPEIQLGELRGYLLDAYHGLINANKFTFTIAQTKDLPQFKSPEITTDLSQGRLKDLRDNPAEWCIGITAVGLLNQPDHFDCALLQSLSLDTLKLLGNLTRALDAFDSTNSSSIEGKLTEYQNRSKDYVKQNRDFSDANWLPLDKIRTILHRANDAASTMQSAAFRYATVHTAGQSIDFRVRIATVNFIVAVSEYSNQIGSRADALMKQLGKEAGRDRRELPLSVHLREAEPTDFVHLYKWMDATSYSFINRIIIGSGSIDDRIKIIDRLYADHYWSKINTVHASGRGKTQMAFVKDETGNWNLKSFDNDPSELLEGYTNVAKTALDGVVKVATRLAKDGASGGGAEVAQQLLALADQTALAKTAQPAHSKGMLSLDHLRDRIASQLNSPQIQRDLTKDTELITQVNSAKTALEDATNTGNTPQADQAKNDLEKATTDLQQHRKAAITRWAALIEDHSNLVDMLGSTIKMK